MQSPLRLSYHNLDTSPAVEAAIRERVDDLGKAYQGIVACRVVVEQPHRHHHQGRLYAIRIELTVPGKEIVVSRGHELNHAYEDIYVMIRDAFDAARRQLQDYIRKRRGQVKHHEDGSQGRNAEFSSEG